MTRRITIAALMALTGAAATSARAAEADNQPVSSAPEEVIVTGTRRAGETPFTSTVPVDVISGEQLRATGYSDLGRALELTEPAANYPRPQTTPSSANTRPITLRGLSPDDVLVLVNGKRWHTTAVINTNFAVGRGSAPFDLSTIPVAAVDHIEILHDAAAAQYGSDAIAGVVNIILKSNADGGSVALMGGETQRGDGANGDLSFNKGLTLGSGGHLTVSGEVLDADHTNRADIDQRYDRLTYSVGDPAALNGSLALSAAYPGPWSGSEIYDDLLVSRKDSTSITNFVIPGTSPLFPDGFRPHINPIIWDTGNTLGFRAALGDHLKADLSNTYGYSDAAFHVDESVNTALGAQSPTTFYAGTERYWQDVTNLNLTQDLPEVLAGADLAAGAEYRHEAYAIGSGQPASYAGAGTSGWPGFNPRIPVDNSREAEAVYLEGGIKPWRWFKLDAAGRYDHYSDFGSAPTWKTSARAEATSWLAFRGSASTGFRAPSLQQEYYSSITSVANGANKSIVNVGTYQVGDPIAQALGASPLQAEKSHDETVGLVLKTGTLSFTADVFRTDINHRIALSDALTGPSVLAVLAAAGVTNVQQAAFFTNALDTRTQGFDLSAQYAVDLTQATHLDASLGFMRAPTRVLSLAANPVLPALPPIGLHSQLLLTQAQPADKLTSQLALSHGPFTGTVAVTRYGSYVDAPVLAAQTFAAKTLVDLSLTVRASASLTFTAGILNVGDVYPDPLQGAALTYASFGGSYVYGEESPFGVDGRSFFGRVELRF